MSDFLDFIVSQSSACCLYAFKLVLQVIMRIILEIISFLTTNCEILNNFLLGISTCILFYPVIKKKKTTTTKIRIKETINKLVKQNIIILISCLTLK